MSKPERLKPIRSASHEHRPLPSAASSGVDARVVEVWCAWLGALATDAEAALAAAMAYKELDEPSRDRWLGALEHDVPRLEVPLIAVYAPLLAVEADPARRARIQAALGGEDALGSGMARAHALGGTAPGQVRVVTVVSPLYLDFVQVLACGYRTGQGFIWVRHDPIVGRAAAPRAGDRIEGVVLEPLPMKPLVDELAHVVLEHQRSGRALPEAVRLFADLFEPLRDVAVGDER